MFLHQKKKEKKLLLGFHFKKLLLFFSLWGKLCIDILILV